MRIEDIEKEVLSWHIETFPNATEDAMSDKLDEEVSEFIKATMGMGGDRVEEFADMCICVIALFGRYGKTTHSLAELIRIKLDVNKGRVWGPESANGNRTRVK